MKKNLMYLVVAISVIIMNSAKAAVVTGSPENNNGCGDNCSWSLDTSTGVLTITGTGDMNYTSSNAPWWSYRTDISSVSMGEGLTSIGKKAFFNLPNLTSVSIPEGVTSIGESAFHYASQLSTVQLPSTLQTIDYHAFCNSGLTSITLPEGVNSIGTEAFYGSSGITSVVIPSTLSYVNSSSFRYLSNLTSLTLAEGITSIGDAAFDGATNLESVVIPNSVNYIGTWAFDNSPNLKSVIIGDNVGNIGYWYNIPDDTKIFCQNNSERKWFTTSKTCEDILAPKNLGANLLPHLQLFTKDDDGVYSVTIDDTTYYYSSADKMMAGGVEAGCTSQEACAAIVAGTATSGSNMSGGSGGTGSNTGNGKRIYTVEEARQAVEAAGTDTVSFRIKYK